MSDPEPSTSAAAAATTTMTSSMHYRPPEPLRIHGSNIADNWKRFHEQWEDYEVAVGLNGEDKKKRGAILLTCVGNEAYDVYRSFEFPPGVDRKDIDNITAAFTKFCVGQVNVTYERYIFNRRNQENQERFEVFLGEIRRLARTCEFGDVLDSMLRDRIVCGLRDDATRRKLLQVRDLTLNTAIDICKSSESASQQLKEMSTASDEVNAASVSAAAQVPRPRPTRLGKDATVPLTSASPTTRRDQPSDTRGAPTTPKKCRYCGWQHDFRSREACPAYGKTCTKCNQPNHFRKVCTFSGTKKRPEVCTAYDI